jgi:hypothetical protein
LLLVLAAGQSSVGALLLFRAQDQLWLTGFA